MLGCSFQQMPRAGQGNYFFQRRPPRRPLCGLLGQPVIAPALVIFRGRRALAKLSDEPIVQQALYDSVERAGAQLNFAAGAQRNFFEDCVTVQILARQRQQHVKHGRRERRVGFRKQEFSEVIG